MGSHAGCEPAGTVSGLLNAAFALWRPTGPGYILKKPCARNLLKVTATGSERGPVSAEGGDGGGGAVLGGHKAGRAEPGSGLIEASGRGCDGEGGVCPCSTCCPCQGLRASRCFAPRICQLSGN